MLNEDTIQNRIIKAALKIAETEEWQDISYTQIAEEAGISLSELHREFLNKKAILRAFSTAVNATVLEVIRQEKQNSNTGDETPQDRLFDILMTRFEVMEPYKPALKKIIEGMKKGHGLENVSLSHLWNTNHWLLEAAEISVTGKRGSLRIAGLSALQIRLLPVWLEDKDPGLAKTMSELDRKLREGAKWLDQTDKLFSKGRSFVKKIMATANCRKKEQTEEKKPIDPDQSTPTGASSEDTPQQPSDINSQPV